MNARVPAKRCRIAHREHADREQHAWYARVVLRISGHAGTETAFDIFRNSIEDIKNEPRWMAVRRASLDLCEKCRQCKFVHACGGGYLPHRFSSRNGYDNPSVYCDDLYATFSHMQDALGSHVYIRKADGARLSMSEATVIGKAAGVRSPERTRLMAGR